MGYNNWNRAIRSGKFESDCRSLRVEQGLNPDLKPKHEWLHENGFSGIQNYAERRGKTVDEVLVDQLGFNERTYDYNISHAKTERLVRGFITEETEDFGTWNDTSVTGGKTALKRVAEFSREARGTDNLVDIGKETPPVAREILKRIFAQMEKAVDDGACRNYGRALERFFNHLVDIGEIEENHVTRILERKDYTPAREAPKEADVPNPTDIRKLLDTENPVLQAAIILLGGAGNRPTNVVTKTTDDCELNPADPRIYSGSENKTGPSTNALMAGREFLESYCEQVKQEQSGDTVYLFPSEKGEKPHLSYEKLLNMIQQHAKEHNITQHDGTPITLKSFKQFYLNLQTKAHNEFRNSDVKKATDMIGDKSAKVKDLNYIIGRMKRDNFREYAESHFAVAFPNQVITTNDIAEARAKTERDEGQMGLEDFTDHTDPSSAN